MTSQFNYYHSLEAYAPRLSGESGSLVSLLDACLVDGYGNKSPAGWSKPLPNYSSSGCWRPASGSRLTLFVNDAGPYNGAAAMTREAHATGYETILGLTHSLQYFTGTGGGQFPYYGQTGLGTPLTMSGSVVWRKSATTGSTERQWQMFADAYTMYLFVQSGDVAGVWSLYAFGDIFSFKQTTDEYKCIIIGRVYNNIANQSVTYDSADTITTLTFPSYVHFMARGWGGLGRSIRVTKVGDAGKGSMNAQNFPTVGIIPVPNPVDGAIYMSPLWISEPDYGMLRGRIRGVWFPCHPIAQFGDGQLIEGTGELSGKRFQIVKQGPSSGMWAIEVSNTVETNDY
jgi:hypothetical protein